MDFPRFVYKSPGQVRVTPSLCYNYVVVGSKAELEERLAAGWHETPESAGKEAGDEAYLFGLSPNRRKRMERHLAKMKRAAPKPEAAPQPAVEEKEDNSPPTRAELEEQCRRLGIRVDGRYGDRRLLALIDEKMRR